MKIYTSYFYQVRFFKPNQIPISTALGDPKWFHSNLGKNFKFIDKNGVINGLRAEFLSPGITCHNLCHGKPCEFSPDHCNFLIEYKRQIFALDKEWAVGQFESIGVKMREILGFKEEPEIMLLVHEAPTNTCSERGVLQEFFNCTEWVNGSRT